MEALGEYREWLNSSDPYAAQVVSYRDNPRKKREEDRCVAAKWRGVHARGADAT